LHKNSISEFFTFKKGRKIKIKKNENNPKKLNIIVNLKMGSNISGVKSQYHEVKSNINDKTAIVELSEKNQDILGKEFILLISLLEPHKPTVVIENYKNFMNDEKQEKKEK